jgi:hypothetical protein
MDARTIAAIEEMTVSVPTLPCAPSVGVMETVGSVAHDAPRPAGNAAGLDM